MHSSDSETGIPQGYYDTCDWVTRQLLQHPTATRTPTPPAPTRKDDGPLAAPRLELATSLLSRSVPPSAPQQQREHASGGRGTQRTRKAGQRELADSSDTTPRTQSQDLACADLEEAYARLLARVKARLATAEEEEQQQREGTHRLSP